MSDIMRLKDVLKEKGVSAKDLAKGIGVHVVTISSIAQNKSIPSKENLIKISEFLNIDIPDLFVGSKKKLYLKGEDGTYEIAGYLK